MLEHEVVKGVELPRGPHEYSLLGHGPKQRLSKAEPRTRSNKSCSLCLRPRRFPPSTSTAFGYCKPGPRALRAQGLLALLHARA
jgi:hypothetical protein